MDGNQETVSAPVAQDIEVMQVVNVQPPEWRPVLNFSHDLGKYQACFCCDIEVKGIHLHSSGYPDFFPARPGFRQPEDVVTPVNVRQGFQGINVVAAGVRQLESILAMQVTDQYLPSSTIGRKCFRSCCNLGSTEEGTHLPECRRIGSGDLECEKRQGS